MQPHETSVGGAPGHGLSAVDLGLQHLCSVAAALQLECVPGFRAVTRPRPPSLPAVELRPI
jgi:hypothetical protein